MYGEREEGLNLQGNSVEIRPRISARFHSMQSLLVTGAKIAVYPSAHLFIRFDYLPFVVEPLEAKLNSLNGNPWNF